MTKKINNIENVIKKAHRTGYIMIGNLPVILGSYDEYSIILSNLWRETGLKDNILITRNTFDPSKPEDRALMWYYLLLLWTNPGHRFFEEDIEKLSSYRSDNGKWVPVDCSQGITDYVNLKELESYTQREVTNSQIEAVFTLPGILCASHHTQSKIEGSDKSTSDPSHKNINEGNCESTSDDFIRRTTLTLKDESVIIKFPDKKRGLTFSKEALGFSKKRVTWEQFKRILSLGILRMPIIPRDKKKHKPGAVNIKCYDKMQGRLRMINSTLVTFFKKERTDLKIPEAYSFFDNSVDGTYKPKFKTKDASLPDRLRTLAGSYDLLREEKSMPFGSTHYGHTTAYDNEDR